MSNRIIYPNAAADLQSLKEEFKRIANVIPAVASIETPPTPNQPQNPFEDQEPREIKFKSPFYKGSRLYLLLEQPQRLGQLVEAECKKFSIYLESVIKLCPKGTVNGKEFIKNFESCFSDQSSTQAQFALLKYFYDQQQIDLLASGNGKIETKTITKTSGTNYKIASVSFMGKHTPGVNSNNHKIGDSSSQLIAAFGDGVSYNYLSAENQEYTGEFCSSTAVNEVEPALEAAPKIPINNLDPSFFDRIESLTIYDLAKLIIGNSTDLQKYIPFSIRNIDANKKETRDINQTNLKQFFKIDYAMNEPLVNLFLGAKAGYKVDDHGSLIPDQRYPTSKANKVRAYPNQETQQESARQFFRDLCDKPKEIFDLLFDKSRMVAKIAQDRTKEQFNGSFKDTNLKGNTTLSFALDQGEYMSFVSQGNSPIIIIKKDGSLVSLKGTLSHIDPQAQQIDVIDEGENTTTTAKPKNDISMTTSSLALPKSEIAAFIICDDGIAEDDTQLTRLKNTILNLKDRTDPEIKKTDPEALIRATLEFFKNKRENRKDQDIGFVSINDDKTIIAAKLEN